MKTKEKKAPKKVLIVEMTLRVNGTSYTVTSDDAGGADMLVRMTKNDGTSYDVIVHSGMKQYSCSCPQFIFRESQAKDGKGKCKHLNALKRVGIMLMPLVAATLNGSQEQAI